MKTISGGSHWLNWSGSLCVVTAATLNTWWNTLIVIIPVENWLNCNVPLNIPFFFLWWWDDVHIDFLIIVANRRYQDYWRASNSFDKMLRTLNDHDNKMVYQSALPIESPRPWNSSHVRPTYADDLCNWSLSKFQWELNTFIFWTVIIRLWTNKCVDSRHRCE